MCNFDESEKAEVFKTIPHYSLPVRIGNWIDRLAALEDKNNVIAYKAVRCQLLVAKTRSMLRNVLEPVVLATAIEAVEYQQVYQIMADLPNTITPTYPQGKGLYLSGLINEKDLEKGLDFNHGCLVTASPDKIPCLRNSFYITNADGRTGAINYGEDIYIQMYSSHKETPALYLQAENCTINNFGSHLQVRLSAQPDVYCHFNILHWKVNMRKDSLGSKVLPDAAVIIKHTASGRNLACENDNWIPTFFGPECMVTCHTFRNQNRMELPQNFWKITGKKEPDKRAVIKAAKGEDIPPEMLE